RIDGLAAQRLGVLAQRHGPLGLVLFIPPCRLKLFDEIVRQLAEGGNAALGLPDGKGIDAIGDLRPELPCLLACVGEWHGLNPAKADLAALAIARPAVEEHPAPARVLAARYSQVEPAAVRVHSRLRRLRHL